VGVEFWRTSRGTGQDGKAGQSTNRLARVDDIGIVEDSINVPVRGCQPVSLFHCAETVDRMERYVPVIVTRVVGYKLRTCNVSRWCLRGNPSAYLPSDPMCNLALAEGGQRASRARAAGRRPRCRPCFGTLAAASEVMSCWGCGAEGSDRDTERPIPTAAATTASLWLTLATVRCDVFCRRAERGGSGGEDESPEMATRICRGRISNETLECVGSC
jgi:hypothetical protein